MSEHFQINVIMKEARAKRRKTMLIMRGSPTCYATTIKSCVSLIIDTCCVGINKAEDRSRKTSADTSDGRLIKRRSAIVTIRGVHIRMAVIARFVFETTYYLMPTIHSDVSNRVIG